MCKNNEENTIKLIRATIKDAVTILKLQTEAFADLLDKYQDYDTNPANESIERIKAKLSQSYTYFYYIVDEDKTVGAIRIVDLKDGSRKRISPLFIMKEFRNRGYAQAAIMEAEKIHGKDNWRLATILQETGNCYLYEKMGYHQSGNLTNINEKMTIVGYEKN